MNAHAIRNQKAWRSPEEVEAVAQRTKEVSDSDLPAEIRRVRSNVSTEHGTSTRATSYLGHGKPGDTNGERITAFGVAWSELAAAGRQVSDQHSSSDSDDSIHGRGHGH